MQRVCGPGTLHPTPALPWVLWPVRHSQDHVLWLSELSLEQACVQTVVPVTFLSLLLSGLSCLGHGPISRCLGRNWLSLVTLHLPLFPPSCCLCPRACRPAGLPILHGSFPPHLSGLSFRVAPSRPEVSASTSQSTPVCSPCFRIVVVCYVVRSVCLSASLNCRVRAHCSCRAGTQGLTVRSALTAAHKLPPFPVKYSHAELRGAFTASRHALVTLG